MKRAAYIAVIGAALWAAPTSAAECRIALLLAIDVSSSVDPNEDKLQRQGLAAALLAPEVQAAFLSSPQPVALSIYEWSGRYNQQTLLDWTLINDPQTLFASAAQLTHSQRQASDYPTALGHAVGHAAKRFAQGPDCDAKVLDVSGDGENNDGFAPKHAYAAFPLDDVTVNGLAIETFGLTASDLNALPGDITHYYKEELIKGANAFVETAQGFENFEDAMRRKLSRELSVLVLGQMTAPERR